MSVPVRRLATLALLAVVAAAPAHGLTIDAATVTVRAGRTDSFRLKGRLSALSLDGATAIELTVDRYAVRVPLDRATRRKQIVTFRDATPGARISRLRVDLARRRFLALGDDWLLSDLPNPLPVTVGTDLAGECRLVRLRVPPARAKPRRVTRSALAPHGDAGVCGALGPPRPSPIAVTAGVATPVHVEVVAPAPAAVDPTSVRLFRTDVGDKAAATPLCTFVADPGDATRLGCDATLTAPTPGSIALVAQGMAGGKPVSSPGFRLPVIVAPTDADVALVPQTQDAMAQAWQDAQHRLGDSLDARLDLIRTARGLPGVLSAGLAPDGVDVVYRHRVGWMGTVVLNRLGSGATPTAAVAPADRRPTASASGVPGPAPRSVFRSCDPSTPADAICCQPSDRRLPLLGRRVLIWDTELLAADRDDAPKVKAKFDALSCMGFQVDAIAGANANVASVAEFPSAATLVVSTHGAVDEYGRVLLATHQEIPAPTHPDFHDFDYELIHGLIGTGDVPDPANPSAMLHVYTVNQDYLRGLPGQFPDRAIVYASYCFSAYGHGSDAYLGKHAGTFFGYDWKVSDLFTLGVADQLFDGLVPNFQTTGDAYAAVTPKLDPYPQTGTVPGSHPNSWLRSTRPAMFTREGDDRIAYVGQPDLTPDTSSLGPGDSAMLSASVDGAGSCALTYHWHGSGDAGTLTGDGGTDDFESTQPTATYTADDDPETTTDDIGVELLSPDDTAAIGASCAEAMVVTTTTTTSTTTTTLATCGAGVIAAVDVIENIHMSTKAFPLMGPGDDQHVFTPTPVNATVGSSAADSQPWNLTSSSAGAEASSSGTIDYTIAPCSITAHGHYHEASVGGSDSGSSETGLDGMLQFTIHVSRYAPYVLTGSVTASGTPTDADTQTMYLRCNGNFGTADASLQSPSGVPVPFGKTSAFYPEDASTILCAAKRGGASTNATGDDMATLDWTFTFTFP